MKAGSLFLGGFVLGGSLFLLRAMAPPAAPERADYVAHEWGTFTSVQGSDGQPILWHPLTTTELPKFVYDRSRPKDPKDIVFAGKGEMLAIQRLETPVIYFYSAEEREINARVSFPQGAITEWYPQQSQTSLAAAKPGAPALRWEQVHILAAHAKAPAPPVEASGSHYYAARATEANSVQVTTARGGTETERFLFYRGVGSFTAPLVVRPITPDGDSLELRNSGAEPLAGMIVYEVRGEAARFSWVPALASGDQRNFIFPADAPLRPLAEIRTQLGVELKGALVKAGLYETEAAAMIHTWDDAWFAEPGLRVLYLLPRPWTDRTLPLTLEPTPHELTRVMVGRAEVLTSSVEQRLEALVQRYRAGDESERQAAIVEARTMSLGRFAEAGIRDVSAKRSQDGAFSGAAWQLLTAAYGTGPSPQVAAHQSPATGPIFDLGTPPSTATMALKGGTLAATAGLAIGSFLPNLSGAKSADLSGVIDQNTVLERSFDTPESSRFLLAPR